MSDFACLRKRSDLVDNHISNGSEFESKIYNKYQNIYWLFFNTRLDFLSFLHEIIFLEVCLAIATPLRDELHEPLQAMLHGAMAPAIWNLLNIIAKSRTGFEFRFSTILVIAWGVTRCSGSCNLKFVTKIIAKSRTGFDFRERF